MLSTLSISLLCSSEHFEEKHLTTPDEHSLQNMREKFQQRRKNPGRGHDATPTTSATLAHPFIF